MTEETNTEVEEFVTEGAELSPEEQQVNAEDEAAKKAEAEAAELEEQRSIEEKEWFKKRMARFTRQKYEERAAREAAEKRAAELEARIKSLETKNEPKEFKPTRPKPNIDEFIDKHDDINAAYAEHAEAIADWKLEQHTAKITAENQQQQARAKAQQAQQTFNEKAQNTAKQGREKYQDWEDVVYNIPAPIFPDHVAQAVIEMTDGASVAYYLGKNLEEAERISQLTPYAMAAELGKIEAKLSVNDKKTTQAPPPIKPLKGNAPSHPELDPDKDPIAWVEARNKGAI